MYGSLYIRYRERTAVVTRDRLAWVMGVFADTQCKERRGPLDKWTEWVPANHNYYQRRLLSVTSKMAIAINSQFYAALTSCAVRHRCRDGIEGMLRAKMQLNIPL